MEEVLPGSQHNVAHLLQAAMLTEIEMGNLDQAHKYMFHYDTAINMGAPIIDVLVLQELFFEINVFYSTPCLAIRSAIYWTKNCLK